MGNTFETKYNVKVDENLKKDRNAANCRPLIDLLMEEIFSHIKDYCLTKNIAIICRIYDNLTIHEDPPTHMNKKSICSPDVKETDKIKNHIFGRSQYIVDDWNVHLNYKHLNDVIDRIKQQIDKYILLKCTISEGYLIFCIEGGHSNLKFLHIITEMETWEYNTLLRAFIRAEIKKDPYSSDLVERVQNLTKGL